MTLHLAAAGGGSAGFHGGGGGHGGGFIVYVLFQILFRIAILGHGLGALVLIGLVLLIFLLKGGLSTVRSFQAERKSHGPGSRSRTAQRERRVELAAAEAAEDDPEFAPDRVRSGAAWLFGAIQRAWDAGDRGRLRTLVAPDLVVEWERRLDDFARRGWRNRVQIIGEPNISYVGLKHRESSSDRVVVRIDAKLHDYVEDRSGAHLTRTGHLGEIVRVREFWTLGRRGGYWTLLSIEQAAEGAHALEDKIVATPWADEAAMRDEALVEAAVADAAPPHMKIAELADLDFDREARVAALDLSLADGRFAPDVLEVAARRAVEAWAEAVDGDDGALRAIAAPQAARELLHPGDPSAKTRLVVRGPRVQQIHIVTLDPAADPPTMTIDVQLSGRRYIEDRDSTAIISGSQTREVRFTERWILALDGDARQPWRIVAVRTAAALT